VIDRGYRGQSFPNKFKGYASVSSITIEVPRNSRCSLHDDIPIGSQFDTLGQDWLTFPIRHPLGRMPISSLPLVGGTSEVPRR
jgi:hypothetical protein